VSSGGFKEVQTITDVDTGEESTGVIDCTSDESSNQGQCSISVDDITLQATGTGIPWVVLVAESDTTTSSSVSSLPELYIICFTHDAISRSQSASIQSTSPSDATTKG